MSCGRPQTVERETLATYSLRCTDLSYRHTLEEKEKNRIKNKEKNGFMHSDIMSMYSRTYNATWQLIQCAVVILPPSSMSHVAAHKRPDLLFTYLPT